MREVIRINMESLSAQLESWRYIVSPIGAWDKDGNRVFVKDFLDAIEPIILKHEVEQVKKESSDD